MGTNRFGIECEHTEGPLHSCGYVEARNSLIEAAMKDAGSGERHEGWTRRFHDAMTTRAAKVLGTSGVVYTDLPVSIFRHRLKAVERIEPGRAVNASEKL